MSEVAYPRIKQIRYSAFWSPVAVVLVLGMVFALSQLFVSQLSGIAFFVIVLLISLHPILTRPKYYMERFGLVRAGTKYQPVELLVTQVALSQQINKPIALLVQGDDSRFEKLSQPFIAGTFTRQYLILPDSVYVEEFTAEEKLHLSVILQHELTHIRLLDHWKYQVFSAFFFSSVLLQIVLSPLVWRMTTELSHRIGAGTPSSAAEIIGTYAMRMVPALNWTLKPTNNTALHWPIEQLIMVATALIAGISLTLTVLYISEFYADSVAANDGNGEALMDAYIAYGLRRYRVTGSKQDGSERDRNRNKLFSALDKLRRKVRYHPSIKLRREAILVDSRRWLSMFGVLSFFGGMLAQLVNWSTRGIDPFNFVHFSLVDSWIYAIPFVSGYVLMSLTNSLFVAGYYSQPRVLVKWLTKNVALFCLGVITVSAVYTTVNYFAPSVSESEILFAEGSHQFNFVQGRIVFGIVLPVVLWGATILDAYVKRKLMFSLDVKVYRLWTSVGAVLICLVSWQAINIAARLLSPSFVWSEGITKTESVVATFEIVGHSGFYHIANQGESPVSLLWTILLFLASVIVLVGSLWIARALALCPKCGSKPQYYSAIMLCQNCGHSERNDWSLTDY